MMAAHGCASLLEYKPVDSCTSYEEDGPASRQVPTCRTFFELLEFSGPPGATGVSGRSRGVRRPLLPRKSMAKFAL